LYYRSLPTWYTTFSYSIIQIRFSSPNLPNLQVLLTLLVLVNSNIFIGVCLYGTTIVLTAVTPFNYTTCILVMGVVCTIYSTMGGIRAVVWTDVLQLIVMVIGILIYIIAGVIQVGGVEHFFSVLEEGQRLQFFNMNPSIYERHTFYNTIAFGAFFFGSIFGVTQLNSQRICSVGTQHEAKK
ncbi:Sodium-coupled monocarboxylate transporter 2, partial [Armadillidium nasatum]